MKIFNIVAAIIGICLSIVILFVVTTKDIGEDLLGSTGSFPTSLSVFVSGDRISSAWANLLEGKIGIDNSAVSTSLDYQLNNSSSVDPGHLHTSSGISGQLSAAVGGTGFGSYATGDVLIASSASALSKLGIGTTGQVLTVSGGLPAWGAAGTTAWGSITGTLSAQTDLQTALDAKLATTSASTTYQTILTNSAGLASALSDETGTSLAVFNTSPNLITPFLGVAQGTSFNGLSLTTASIGFTMAGGDTSKTLTVNETKSLSDYLFAAGTRPLTGNWDIGNFSITGSTFISTASVGTAPLTVTSTTKVSNFNADLLDGISSASFFQTTGNTATRSISFTLESPADADNFLLFKAPWDMTITDIDCIVDPADSSESVIIDVQERDATADNPATVDATITCDNDGAADDGSFSNGSIDIGDWLSLDIATVSGTVTQVSATIKFTLTTPN